MGYTPIEFDNTIAEPIAKRRIATSNAIGTMVDTAAGATLAQPERARSYPFSNPIARQRADEERLSPFKHVVAGSSPAGRARTMYRTTTCPIDCGFGDPLRNLLQEGFLPRDMAVSNRLCGKQ